MPSNSPGFSGSNTGSSSRFMAVKCRNAVFRSSFGETLTSFVVITSRATASRQIVSSNRYARTSSSEKMPTIFPSSSTTGK